MRAPGGAARPSAPNASKPNWPSNGPRPDARSAQQRLLASLDGLCSHASLEAYLRDMADTRSLPVAPDHANCLN